MDNLTGRTREAQEERKRKTKKAQKKVRESNLKYVTYMDLMKKAGVCAKCGSKNIKKYNKVYTYAFARLRLTKPLRMPMKGPGVIFAYRCERCGYIELYSE